MSSDQRIESVDPRILRARSGIDISTGRGFEVGPLHRPIVRKDEADVLYVDYADTDWLREHYANDPNVPVADIVDVDFVLVHGDATLTMAEAAASAAPYRWGVASHVIEHVPDVIAFLRDAAELLEDGGHLALVIPDRRYCFDALRPATTIGEMLLAHENGDRRPSVRAVFDHFVNAISYSPPALWRGELPNPGARIYSLDDAWGLVQQRRQTNEYIDTHTWLFTPRSFVEQMEVLARLGQIDFTVSAIHPTSENDIEFFVTLERIPRNVKADDRQHLLDAGFPDVMDTLSTTEQPSEQFQQQPAPEELPTGTVRVIVSTREQRFIVRKRRILGAIRCRLPRRRR